MERQPGRIRILDEITINQIAAGEVVERPASVVKELVENSLDAGATEVIVEIRKGGRKLIRVTDDGIGMDRDDLVLAFEKHATSKIRTAADLEKVASLGFRGEALPSIASVSRLEAESRCASSESGWRLRIEGGELKEVKPTGTARGTSIRVRDLFFNVPARHKHLKGQSAETALITDMMTRFVLLRPEIGFRLRSGGEELISAPKNQTPVEAFVTLYGTELARDMLNLSADDDGIRLRGFVSRPSIARKAPNHIYFFINGRFVTSATLSRAIKEAYKTLILKHHHPMVILHLDIPPEEVDVNVHPAKAEVRFLNDRDVFNAVVTALGYALRRHETGNEIAAGESVQRGKNVQGDKGEEEGEDHKPGTIQRPITAVVDNGERIVTPPITSGQPTSKSKASSVSWASVDDGSGDRPAGTSPAVEGTEKRGTDKDIQESIEDKTNATQALLAQPTISRVKPMDGGAELPPMKALAQVLDTYILASTPDGLVIIDQHAAAERIQLERLTRAVEAKTPASQELIEPVVLELSPGELRSLEAWGNALEEAGYRVEDFGGRAVQVIAVPVTLGKLGDPQTVRQVLADLLEGPARGTKSPLMDQLLCLTACRSALKAGESLTLPRMQSLLDDLASLEQPHVCAHGRPTWSLVTKTELEKRFRRIV